MSVHITGNKIRATGKDANGLFIAMASDERLLEWNKKQTGSEEFRTMVKEAIAARNIQSAE